MIKTKERIAKMDREKVIKALECRKNADKRCGNPCEDIGLCHYATAIRGLDGEIYRPFICDMERICADAITLLKEQKKKQITLNKKHVITWKRDDEFTMRKLYEAVCETLLDEGELVIVRIDDHEKVDFTFYVTEGR